MKKIPEKILTFFFKKRTGEKKVAQKAITLLPLLWVIDENWKFWSQN